MRLRDLESSGCARCAWTGWRCEHHPDRPLHHAEDGRPCGGAGLPCPDCNLIAETLRDPIALDINCVRCGGALQMQLGPSPAGALSTSQPWRCPWCGHDYADFRIDGPVCWVAMRPTRTTRH